MIVDKNNRAKVYINEKEIHDIKEIDIHGESQSFDISIKQTERNADGKILLDNNMIKTVTTEYHMGI